MPCDPWIASSPKPVERRASFDALGLLAMTIPSIRSASRLQFEAIALQLPGEAAVHGEEGDEAGLDGVINVGTPLEDARDGLQRAVELGMPAMRLIDHMRGEEAPDAPV